MIRARKGILGLVTAVAALGAGQALAASEPITVAPGCCAFAKPAFALDPGQVASFQNTGDVSHDVAATGKGPDGEALFSSEIISAGQTPVNGTQYLEPGSYPFLCTIHPEMTANLVVSGAGSPLPRPGIEIKVLSRRLEKVVSSRKLKVRVTAEGAAEDVALVARKGARKLGSKRGLDLAEGSSRRVKMRLTRTGRKVLDDLGSARVKVTGTVAFGARDTAKRKLR